MPFMDIAFQAEVSRFEDPEFEEMARRNCNEDPDTRSKRIEELRSLIYERGECNPRRIDDAYLLRFLRARQFVPARAHKLMVRYEQFRRDYAYLYDCDAFSLHKVKNVYGGTVPESPRDGRIILMRFGRWDTDVASAADVLRCALLMNEVVTMQPKMQILGFTIIVDLKGLGLRHIRQLNSSVAHQAVSLLGVSYPIKIHGIHVVNYSWFVNQTYYLFKQFIPKNMKSYIFFHSDMESLHSRVDPEYLPPEYGGCSRNVVTTEEWVIKVNKYKDEFLTQELRDLGFTVNS